MLTYSIISLVILIFFTDRIFHPKVTNLDLTKKFGAWSILEIYSLIYSNKISSDLSPQNNIE